MSPGIQSKAMRAARSNWKALRYMFVPRPWPLERPVVVQFPINDICDSKCQMCNIWQQKLDRQVSVDQARRVFSSPLFRDVVAVGLNGGEPTLRRDLADLGDALFSALPNLQQISLITNGLNARRAIDRISELGAATKAHGGRLDVMVSLDGVGEVHDLVRGVPGNFEQAVHVLDFLREHADLASRRVGCTVITENVYHLHELHDFCIDHGTYVKFRLGVPNRRLYNLPAPGPRTIGKRTWIDTQPFGLDEEQRWHFAQFLLGLCKGYEESLAQIQFYQSLSGQLIAGLPRRAGCDWQHRGVTVSSRGEILYCAVQSDVLGNGLDEDPEDLYFRNRAHLQQIIRDKCASCAHDYVGPPGGSLQRELVLDRLLRRTGSSLRSLKSSGTYQTLVRAKRNLIEPLRIARQRRGLRVTETDDLHGNEPRHGVLLCGWYGTETLGDKAILASIVTTIRSSAPDEPIRIASLEPNLTRITVAQMPELAECQIIDLETALKTLSQHRALVFAGGPLMAIPSMVEMEGLFRRARHAGVPGIVAGCGVGPLGSAAANRPVAGLLQAASHRIYRDERSREEAARLIGPDALGDLVADDPAAAWATLSTNSEPGDPDVLGLGLRDWPYREYASRMSTKRAEEVRANFEAAVINSLERLLSERPRLRVLPIPFCTHDVGGDDRLLYWRLIQRSKQLRKAADVSLLSREPTPNHSVESMRRCGAFLAMRFHSLVFASTLGIPVVSIDYTLGTGKTHSLGTKLGCDILRIDEIDGESLYSALHTALQSSPKATSAPTFQSRLLATLVAAGVAPSPLQ